VRKGSRFALFTITNGVTACLMISALSLLVVQAIGAGHALILALAILYGRARGTAPPRPLFWDALALLALLIFPLDLFLFSRSLIGSALRLLSFVVIYRCSNLPGRRELRQAVALSFVQILAAAASTTEAYFGPLLAAYLAMAIWTLMAMASARDDAPAGARRAPTGRPVFVMTAATVALGAVLFFAMPHLGTGYLQQVSALRGAGDGISGFSNRIELGSINQIKKSRSIVMRVRIIRQPGFSSAASLDLRWRGLAFDTFDGRSWSVARMETDWVGTQRDGWYDVGQPIPAGQSDMLEEISLEPSLMSLLFTSPGAARVQAEDLSTLGVDAAGSIHMQIPALHRLSYQVVSPDPQTALAGFGSVTSGGEGRMTRYLTLPRLDARVEALAHRLTQKADTDFERARIIEEYLRSNYSYTLDVDDAGVADPVSHFLIERNAGHCEYFATGMAILLRHLSIPSRVVNGFAAGQWSPLFGGFIVRQSDAHAWVEAWMPERGWVTFDPTPSEGSFEATMGPMARFARLMGRIELVWDTWIIGLDLLDQQSFVSTLMDTGRAVAAALRSGLAAMNPLAGSGGVARALSALALAAGVIWIAMRRGTLAWLRAFVGRPARRRTPSDPATLALRRFEARWAKRGLRRSPGQTPMEFAREIERSALDAPGAAVGFVESYYNARYGGGEAPSA